MPYKAQIKELQVSMQKALDHLTYQFKEIRTGKAPPASSRTSRSNITAP